MAGDSPSPHLLSQRLGLAAHPSWRRNQATLLGRPSFHDPRTHHVLESHPERAAPFSRSSNERRYATRSHFRVALALRLYLVACNPSSSCRFQVLDHLWSNLSQPFQSCRITETRSLNLCVFTFSSSAFAFLIEMDFSFESLFAIWLLSPQQFHYHFYLSVVSRQYQKFWTILILALCHPRLCLTRWFACLNQALPRLHLSSAAVDKGIVSYLHIHCFPMLSIDVVAAALDDSCICW